MKNLGNKQDIANLEMQSLSSEQSIANLEMQSLGSEKSIANLEIFYLSVKLYIFLAEQSIILFYNN